MRMTAVAGAATLAAALVAVGPRQRGSAALRQDHRPPADVVVDVMSDQADHIETPLDTKHVGKGWLAGSGPGQVPVNRIPSFEEWKVDLGIGLDAGDYYAMAYDDSAAKRIHRADTSSPRERARTVQHRAPTTATAPQMAIDLGVVFRLRCSVGVVVDMVVAPS